MNEVFKICQSDQVLKSALAYLIQNNTGNSNPYHCFEHSINVFLNCVEAAEYHELPEKERLNLLIAALFHDINHSAGKFKDSINIQNAKMAVQEWSDKQTDPRIDLEQIYSFIDITEFPYQTDANSLNLMQQILRDADMGSIFTSNWFQTIMLGLSSEAKTDLNTFVEQQKNFMKNLKPNTEWFKEKKMPLLEEKLADLDLYAEYILFQE